MKQSFFTFTLFILSTIFSINWDIGDTIINYTINPKKQNLQFYLKNESGVNYSNFDKLRHNLTSKNEKLIFAMNGGMYKKDGTPQGLYIENCITISPIENRQDGYGNFYLQPNGIFYLTTNNTPHIVTTSSFRPSPDIKYATQSGPMLLIDGKVHPKFTKGSKNIHIRNGVGILPNGHLIFAISTEKINFYDFASYFKNKGCKNALYLDGFVSKMYLPSKNVLEKGGSFGVIIGETVQEK